MQAKRITVYGKVQGVGFRYFVQHTARKLGLHGDVRNCPDSSVEIFVQGGAEEIGKLLDRVKQGPPLSRVQRVECVDVPTGRAPDSFTIEGW
jgi:acylphosphatase